MILHACAFHCQVTRFTAGSHSVHSISKIHHLQTSSHISTLRIPFRSQNHGMYPLCPGVIECHSAMLRLFFTNLFALHPHTSKVNYFCKTLPKNPQAKIWTVHNGVPFLSLCSPHCRLDTSHKSNAALKMLYWCTVRSFLKRLITLGFSVDSLPFLFQDRLQSTPPLTYISSDLG